MAQLYRDQFAHWVNTGTASSPDYELEGIGVDAFAISYNPQVDTYKTIIQRNATNTFKNYQIQGSISGKRLYSEDEVYKYLDTARKNATALETDVLEINMTTNSGGTYEATKYDVLIVINEFLGEDATISYDYYFQNLTQGTVVMTNSKPVFTPTTSL